MSEIVSPQGYNINGTEHPFWEQEGGGTLSGVTSVGADTRSEDGYEIYTWYYVDDTGRHDIATQRVPSRSGVTFTPSVSKDGVISWENDGDLPNPPAIKIMGPAPKMTVTASAESGEDAGVKVTRSGEDAAPKYDFAFTLPRGERGERGETGETGPEGKPGATGPEGPRGETGATGEPGPKGDTGPAPEISITATVDSETGEPSAEVVKSGSGAEQSFEIQFHGLKGATGEQGPRGERGEAGPEGPKGKQGVPGPEGPAGKDGEGKVPNISADVDQTTGTAQVTVDQSGENVTFHFSGLKGEAGEAGAPGEQGAPGEPGKNGENGAPGKDGVTPEITFNVTASGGDEASASVSKSGSGAEQTFDLSLTLPKGPKGDRGETGETGPRGETGETGPRGETGETGTKGDTGPAGPAGERGPKGDPGQGVPAGGKTGDVLKKTGDGDYDTEWAPEDVGLPVGGTIGQVLSKLSDANNDVGWKSIIFPREYPKYLFIPLTCISTNIGYRTITYKFTYNGSTYLENGQTMSDYYGSTLGRVLQEQKYDTAAAFPPRWLNLILTAPPSTKQYRSDQPNALATYKLMVSIAATFYDSVSENNLNAGYADELILEGKRYSYIPRVTAVASFQFTKAKHLSSNEIEVHLDYIGSNTEIFGSRGSSRGCGCFAWISTVPAFAGQDMTATTDIKYQITDTGGINNVIPWAAT